MITREIRFPFDYNKHGTHIPKNTWFSIDESLYRQLRDAGWKMEVRERTPTEEARTDAVSRSGPPVITKGGELSPKPKQRPASGTPTAEPTE